MRVFFRSLFARSPAEQHLIQDINRFRASWHEAGDDELREICRRATELTEVVAVSAIAAKRALGLELFDVQLEGALALAGGRIAEMQTGEGKTLTAVPAVVWLARVGAGVHVMTVNDYLARRDAQWMGAIYRRLGFTVGCVQQNMTPAERKQAYACDITYATANEIGFDYMRDQLALHPDEQVHRPFAAALIDEADFHTDRRSAHSARHCGRRAGRRTTRGARRPRRPLVPRRVSLHRGKNAPAM